MLAPDTLDVVDDYWAGFLGVSREQLRPAEPLVVAHAELADYAGMYAQSIGGAAPIVSLPPVLMERYGTPAAHAAAGGLVDDGRWSRVFGDAVTAVIGPAEVRCADAATLRPPPGHPRARLLTREDAPALQRLRRECDETEWAHGGGIEFGANSVAGVFADGELAAVAGYQVWGGRIAHVGVVTHPAYRGRGLGVDVVARVALTALDGGMVPQYRALASNAPSLRIAGRLGFVPYAVSLAVRLRPEPA